MKPSKPKQARKPKKTRRHLARDGHPSLEEDTPGPNWVDQLDDGALKFIFDALTSGQLIARTPFQELEREHPILWRRAQQVFGSREIARDWLETRTELFRGQRPLSVAMRGGGEKRVLRLLDRLRPTKPGNPENGSQDSAATRRADGL